MGTFLASGLKSVMEVDACCIESVLIKGETLYTSKDLFTLAALKNEIPSDMEMVIVEWTGAVLRDAVRESRSQDPAKECAWFFQCDKDMDFDATGKELLIVNGAPLDEQRVYRVAVAWKGIYKYRANPVLKAWLEENPDGMPPTGEAGVPAKVLLVRYFCKFIWQKLPSFEELDTSGDGFLDKKEVEKAYLHAFGMDVDGDGEIEEHEIRAVVQSVDMLINSLDKNGDGKVSRDEYEHLLGDTKM
mmetsp:Transcript_23651/g.58784  ORF Transcript_23651/g.58784 Transcript_23651/m.58784 type:complete len:245 (-) Transcript_23651:139-873(-)